VYKSNVKESSKIDAEKNFSIEMHLKVTQGQASYMDWKYSLHFTILLLTAWVFQISWQAPKDMWLA